MTDDAIIEELSALGASSDVVQAALFLIAGAEVDRQTIAQRARRLRERRHRLRLQASRKPDLKARCLRVFGCKCQYCNRSSSLDLDPDGQPWALERIKPGKFGGEYEAKNVTLACARCNAAKGTNWPIPYKPPSLADAEAERKS